MTEAGIHLMLLICGMTATTVLMRGAFVLLPQRWQLPDSVQAPLRYAPIAAISAIVAPELFASGAAAGALGFSGAFIFNAKVAGALFGAAAYVRYGNMGGAIGAGMAAFWLARWLLP